MPPRSRPSALRLTLALLLAAALLLSASPASAHAILVSADPADGAVLDTAPKQARLRFSETILLGFTTIELVDGDDHVIPVAAVRADPADSSVVIIDLPSLPPNAYRLTWRTLSDDDVHISTGAIVFGVQQAAGVAPVVVAAAPPPIEVLLRWLNLAALAGLLGALAVALFVLPEASFQAGDPDNPQLRALPRSVRRRLLWLALWAGVAALVVGAGLLLAQATAIGGAWWDLLTRSSYGLRWFIRQGLLVQLIAAVVVLLGQNRRKPERRNFPAVVVAVLALELAVTHALNSHATAFNESSPWRIAASALHLLAASLWVGGLLALTVLIAPLLRRDPEAGALAQTTLRRFGGLAVLSVAVLMVTGLYNSGQQVASLDALLLTLYGQTLLLKVGLVLGVGLLGLFNSAALHPRVAEVLRRILWRPSGWAPFALKHLWLTVLVETIGVVTVLFLAARLSATQPARGPEWEPPAEEAATAPIFTTPADDLFITLSVKPNRPGQNFISLGVFNTRRPPPAPIDHVVVQLQPPSGQSLSFIVEPLDDGRYQIAGDAINADGQWQISITVIRLGLPNTVVDVPWTVMPPQPPVQRHPVMVSNRPLAPWLSPLALVMAVFVNAAWIGLWLRSRLSSGAAALWPFRIPPAAKGLAGEEK